MSTSTTQTHNERLGKLISTGDGHGPGPRYAEVYTAPAGDTGFIVGYRTHANEGLGLIGRRWFATRKAALDYAATIR